MTDLQWAVLIAVSMYVLTAVIIIYIITRLKQTISALRTRNNQLVKDVNKSNNTVINLTQTNASQERQITSLNDQNANLNRQLANLETNNDLLKKIVSDERKTKVIDGVVPFNSAYKSLASNPVIDTPPDVKREFYIKLMDTDNYTVDEIQEKISAYKAELETASPSFPFEQYTGSGGSFSGAGAGGSWESTSEPVIHSSSHHHSGVSSSDSSSSNSSSSSSDYSSSDSSSSSSDY